jgi:hypothetical protein
MLRHRPQCVPVIGTEPSRSGWRSGSSSTSRFPVRRRCSLTATVPIGEPVVVMGALPGTVLREVPRSVTWLRNTAAAMARQPSMKIHFYE